MLLGLYISTMVPLCTRAQELCESRGGRPRLPVPNSPYGLCGRKATLNLNSLYRLIDLSSQPFTSLRERDSERDRGGRRSVSVFSGGRGGGGGGYVVLFLARIRVCPNTALCRMLLHLHILQTVAPKPAALWRQNIPV